MKQFTFRSFFLALVFSAGIGTFSCKNKAKEADNSADSTQTVNSNGVNVASDEELTKQVQDATKDYPEVQATVTNGEVTLAGSVDSTRYMKLIQSINDLHPKKVNNLLDKK
jgi:osmotically-inducible protein OsmY